MPPQRGCSPRRRPRQSPPSCSPADSSCPSARSPAAHLTGNQRRRGTTATAGGTTWRHRRGAAPSSHEPGQPPPRPHVVPPRPAPPAPRPRPRSAPGAKEAQHEWTSTQGRTQFVACGRDSPAPEPFGEQLLPALQGRDPGAADRGPLRAGSPSSAPPSAHPPRASPGRTTLHLHSAAVARLGCGGTSDPGSGPCHQRPWPRPGPLDHRPPRCGGLDVERHGAHRGVATEPALKAAPRGRAQQGRRRCG